MAASIGRAASDPEFPCSLIIKTPFPTHRLASTALQALQVDAELSPLVRRKFSLITPPSSPISTSSNDGKDPFNSAVPEPATTNGASTANNESEPISSNVSEDAGHTVLLTEYRAKTNRMLRVAVNGFMENLGVVLGVMERLDVDVLAQNNSSCRDAAAGL